MDKEKFDKLVESLTMLLSNGKITPEESDGLIEGIKGGGTSYEFAFQFHRRIAPGEIVPERVKFK